MIVDADKKFIKDFQNIGNNKIRDKIEDIIKQIAKATLLADISNIQKIEGSEGYYRIKFDYRYRIGLFYDGETIVLLKVSTRENFYKKFPKK